MAANGIRLQGKKHCKTSNQTQGRESWAPDQPRGGPGGDGQGQALGRG
jgi:hypothetical protein